MSAKERLKQFIEYTGMTKNAFLSEVGLSPAFLGSGTGIHSDKIRDIYFAFPQLNINWLILGQGNMIKEDRSSAAEERKKHEQELDAIRKEIQHLQNQINLLKEIVLYQRVLLKEKGVDVSSLEES